MMKKIFLILFLAIIIFALIIQLFWATQNDKHKLVPHYEQFVIEETGFSIVRAERYHGDQLYYIFTAINEQGNHVYVAVDESYELNVIEWDLISYSKDQIINRALNDYAELEKIIRVNPAYERNQFSWEIVAQGETNSLEYVYYTMQDGTFQKRYSIH